MADRQTDDFKLGNKAADMWLYTADACANEKVIPKKYRYTTGTVSYTHLTLPTKLEV